MKDTGLLVPGWSLLARVAAPPIITFDEPELELLSHTDSNNSSDHDSDHGPDHRSNHRSNPQLLQPTGEMCAPEGQWNCMTSSWQRCASGMWSVVVPCATGTICQPFGLTDFITIEHEASGSDVHEDNGHASDGKAGDGGHDKSGKKSLGHRNSPGLVLLVGAAVAGISWSFLL